MSLLLRKGDWSGQGRVVIEGTSLGVKFELDPFSISDDEGGWTLTGQLSGEFDGQVSIRIAADEEGTYVIDAQVAGLALDGRAKMESQPNLALLWNAAHTQAASVTLFQASGGIGCRGFFHEAGRTCTWEVRFVRRQERIGGDNVVSLARRRR